MSKLSYVALAGALALLASAPANAALVGLNNLPNGNLTFKFLGGSSQPSGVDQYGNETTYLAGAVTSINQGIGTVWAPGTGNEYLGFVAYGIADQSFVANGNGTYTIYSDGATGGTAGTTDGLIHVDIYQSSTAPNISAGPAGRSSFSTYSGITGTPWLQMVMIPGVSTTDSTATLVQTTNSTTDPATGNGTFYADVVGGTAMSEFANGGFTTALNTTADVYGQFDLAANGSAGSPLDLPGACTTTNENAGGSQNACWQERVSDPLNTTSKVPEPGTLSLMAGFLLALGFASRYFRDKQA